MYISNKNDQEIIRNASNWATRSLAKVRSLLQGGETKFLFDTLIKVHNAEKEFKDAFDLLLNGDTRSAQQAFADINSAALTLDGIISKINNIVVPRLVKDGILIAPERPNNKPSTVPVRGKGKKKNENDDAAPTVETPAPKRSEPREETVTTPPGTPELVADPPAPEEPVSTYPTFKKPLSDKDIEEMTGIVNEMIAKYTAQTISGEDSEAADKLREVLEKVLFTIKLPNLEQDSIITVYEKAKTTDLELFELYKKNGITASQGIYKTFIKNATTMEAVMAYQLLSIAKYGPVKTPLKETWHDIKTNFQDIFGDPTNTSSYRKDCIIALKGLIKQADELSTNLEKAIKENAAGPRWTEVIDGFNSFSQYYNTSVRTFDVLFNILKSKAQSDNLQKGKKKKSPEDDMDFLLDDFTEYKWQNLPHYKATNFKILSKIVIPEAEPKPNNNSGENDVSNNRQQEDR